MSLGFEAGPTNPQSRSQGAARAEGRLPSGLEPVSAKLSFTLEVAYHMIVPFVVSLSRMFPNGKVGIMDSDLSHLEPVSAHNLAGYAITAILLIHLIQEGAAC
jgi:hypothetical protein